MANLKLIDKSKIREPRPLPKPLKNPGVVISYTIGRFDMKVDSDVIREIIYSFGLGPNQEIIHKVLFAGDRVIYVTQEGLDDLLS